MKVFLRFNRKWFLFACVLLNVVSESFCLRCYECFWSREKVDLKEYQEMFLARKTLAYPMVTAQKIIDTKKHPSTQEEFKRCATRTCSNSHWCLQWSYISNEPQNITYTCVGNPDFRKGCYEQEIPEKHLKVKACLCNNNLCNKQPSIHHFHVLQSILITAFSLFIYKMGLGM